MRHQPASCTGLDLEGAGRSGSHNKTWRERERESFTHLQKPLNSQMSLARKTKLKSKVKKSKADQTKEEWEQIAEAFEGRDVQ